MDIKITLNFDKIIKNIYKKKKNTENILFVITVISMMRICCGKQHFNLF